MRCLLIFQIFKILRLESLDDQFGQSAQKFGFVGLISSKFVNRKMADDGAKKQVAKPLVGTHGIGNPFHLGWFGQFEKDVFALLDVGVEKVYEQRVLHFQDGAQGLVLEGLLWLGLDCGKLQVRPKLEQLMFVAHGIFTKVPATTTRGDNGFGKNYKSLCKSEPAAPNDTEENRRAEVGWMVK